MWVEISDDLMGDFPQPDNSICAVLESIALSSFYGRHMVYASRQTLRWLLGQSLSGAAKAAISRIHSRVSEYGALRATADFRLIVQSAGDGLVRTQEGDWYIPIRNLVGGGFPESELLVENLRDGYVYQLAARSYSNFNKLSKILNSIAVRHGGGNEISRCYQAEIDARRSFTLAVTDSDLDHPEAAPCITSTQCEAIANASTWVTHHYRLTCREVENILPVNLLEDSIEGDAGSAELKDKFSQIKEVFALRTDFYRYCDLKIGMVGFFSTASDVQVSRRTYWGQVRSDITPLCKVSCAEKCSAGTHKLCKCIIVDGLGDKTVDRFLSHCNSISEFKLQERIQTSFNNSAWLAVGQQVFWWGLADDPIRV